MNKFTKSLIAISALANFAEAKTVGFEFFDTTTKTLSKAEYFDDQIRGKGSFGTVYQGKYNENDIAVKVIDKRGKQWGRECEENYCKVTDQVQYLEHTAVW